VVGGNLIMNAQNISATTNYAWTLLNSSGGIVATRTGGSSTISVSGTGSFTLSLIATNFCGRSDTTQVTINICAPLGGGFSHTVNGNTVTFSSLAVNSAGQLWDFGDGNQGSGSNPSHTYAGSGSYTVIMRSYNICGDTITSSQSRDDLQQAHGGMDGPNPFVGRSRNARAVQCHPVVQRRRGELPVAVRRRNNGQRRQSD